MAKKPNKYTRLIRYMVETMVNDKYQRPYIDKIIGDEWKEFFETLEKALQSVEEINIEEIKIPIKDFKIIFEGFSEICNEYAGAKEIDEIYIPILKKYYSLYEEGIK